MESNSDLSENPIEIRQQQNPASASVPDLSIVISAIDERENLEILLPALWEVLTSMAGQGRDYRG